MNRSMQVPSTPIWRGDGPKSLPPEAPQAPCALSVPAIVGTSAPLQQVLESLEVDAFLALHSLSPQGIRGECRAGYDLMSQRRARMSRPSSIDRTACVVSGPTCQRPTEHHHDQGHQHKRNSGPLPCRDAFTQQAHAGC